MQLIRSFVLFAQCALFVLSGISMSSALQAQVAPTARMASKQYWAPEVGTYLEIQMAFDGRSVAWTDAGADEVTGEQLFRAAVEWTVIALDGAGEIVDFRKSVARTERMTAPSDFIDIVRLPLLPGHYALEWTAVDLGADLSAGAGLGAGPSGTKQVKMRFDAPIEIDTLSTPDISGLFWVQAYRASGEATTALTRAGREILPLVSSRVGMEAERLPFYGEIYGSTLPFAEGSEFLVSAWFRNTSGEAINQRYFKMEAAPVVSIFEMMELPEVPGLYELVLGIHKRDGSPIVSRSLAFELMDKSAVSAAISLSQLAPFVLNYSSRDSLWSDLQMLEPIAGAVELRTLEFSLVGADLATLRGFMHTFWSRRNAEDPGSAWRDYQREVAIVDREFRDCRNRPGHQTEMGAILLQYGRPNTIVKRHSGTQYYPYEIWHYHKAGQFNDKRFLFYAPMAVAACFELLHSDMQGFVRNTDWLDLLRTRENSNSVHETMLNGLNPGDAFSREEPEDLFYNPR